MPYLCVDKDGQEIVFERIPVRNKFDRWTWSGDIDRHNSSARLANFCELPKGTISKLIGRELTWEDEPYLLE